MTTWAALFWFSFRQALLQRRIWPSVLILACAPGIIGLVRYFDPESGVWERYHRVMQFALLAFAVPLVCMLHGAELLGSEVEARTIVYLLTRRLRRATVLVIRFLATWLALSLLIELTAIAAFAAGFAGLDIAQVSAPRAPHYRAWQPWHDFSVYLAVLPVAAAAFLAVFAFIGLLAARPLILSVVYLVVVELALANVPAGIQKFSVSRHVRAIMFERIPSLFGLHEIPPELRNQLYPPGSNGLVPLALILIGAVAVACFLVTIRELVPAKLARE